MKWGRAFLPVLGLSIASVVVGTCASFVRRAGTRSAPELRCVVESLAALETSDAERLGNLFAVYRALSRSENYVPRFDPVAFGGSVEAREAYLKVWTDDALASLRAAGMEKPSAARIIESREMLDPKGIEVVLGYDAPQGRLLFSAVVMRFAAPRLAFIAPGDWRATREQKGVLPQLVHGPSNVYLVDPGLLRLVGGRMPPAAYPRVGVAGGLPANVARRYLVADASGITIDGPGMASEPVEEGTFADAATRVRDGAKAMVVFASGAVRWRTLQGLLTGLSSAGFEEAAFVVRTRTPPSAEETGHLCYGMVRCALGARIGDPDLQLAAVVRSLRWAILGGEGGERTATLSPTDARFRERLESAARGAGARLHLPPDTTLDQIAQALQFFIEEPSKVELGEELLRESSEGQ